MREAPSLALSVERKFCSRILRLCRGMSAVHTRPTTIVRNITDGRQACKFLIHRALGR
jgi:hypothetical protein